MSVFSEVEQIADALAARDGDVSGTISFCEGIFPYEFRHLVICRPASRLGMVWNTLRFQDLNTVYGISAWMIGWYKHQLNQREVADPIQRIGARHIFPLRFQFQADGFPVIEAETDFCSCSTHLLADRGLCYSHCNWFSCTLNSANTVNLTR
jgi:hypothetical protein